MHTQSNSNLWDTTTVFYCRVDLDVGCKNLHVLVGQGYLGIRSYPIVPIRSGSGHMGSNDLVAEYDTKLFVQSQA